MTIEATVKTNEERITDESPGALCTPFISSEVSPRYKTDEILGTLLTHRPTLRPLIEAPTLGRYLEPVLHWKFRPDIFPNARLFLDLVRQEISECYDESTAELVSAQLETNFTVETGVHVSLPRLYDRATLHSIPLNNVNTLTFQATLYSAAARLAAGQSFHISCSSGHVSLSNINSGAYFQPDARHCLRLLPNKLDKTPQTYLPPLTKEGVEKILHGKDLTPSGKNRAETFLRIIEKHPDSFSRQITTAHAALYNEVLPPDIRQITFDFELIVPAFLSALLRDPTSLTYRLFSTVSGRDFLRNEFVDVVTAWKRDVPPFDVIERRHGYVHVSTLPYLGNLSPESLCEALEQKTIRPKTALSFILFMLEAGLAPVGGMRQTQYATQIRDRLAAWLRQDYPDDPRIELLSVLPTDRAVLAPLWGVNSAHPEHLVSYKEALNGWRLSKEEALEILTVPGHAALAAGAILMDDSFFGKEKTSDETRQALLREIADTTDILKCAEGFYEPRY